jgi:hypothetical protein
MPTRWASISFCKYRIPRHPGHSFENCSIKPLLDRKATACILLQGYQLHVPTTMHLKRPPAFAFYALCFNLCIARLRPGTAGPLIIM